MAVGTPGYMAPEQARGQRLQIGPATDVYALGVLLYEMITGRLPFQAATPMDVMLKVAREEPTPPSRVRPRLPRDLETICLKCLEKDPARRYASALDLAEDLRAFSAHEPIRARPVPRWERCLRWVRRRPAALLLVTLTLLAASLVTAATASAYAERQRLGGLRAEARDKVQQGRIAFDHRRWNEVRALLSPVVPRIQEEPALAGLSQEARQLLEPAEAHLATQAHYDKFLHLRAEVLFEAALVGGDGSPDRLRQIRGLVEQALAEVLERADAPAAPPPELRAQPVAFNPLLTEEQAQEARQGCYDLLLVLADATAQCAPRDAPAVRSSRAWAALAVLDRAARLGLRTHAFHLRRAAYLGQAGDESEASAERARAAAHPLKTAFDHYLAGTTRYHWQHFDKAREGLRQALEFNPGTSGPFTTGPCATCAWPPGRRAPTACAPWRVPAST
jgi:hypothetical protein